MIASQIRTGQYVDGRKVARVVPAVRDTVPHVQFIFTDGSASPWYRADAHVNGHGYTDPFPAEHNGAKPFGRKDAKPRMSNGVWAGERDGSKREVILARSPAYDLRDRGVKRPAGSPFATSSVR